MAETILGLAIAKNHRHEKVMTFKPRDKDAFIIDKHMLFEILIFGSLVSLFSIILFYVGIASYYDFHKSLSSIRSPEYIDKSAIYFGSFLAFMSIGICLTLNGICARTSRSIFKESWKDSKLMVFAMMGSLLLVILVAYVPELNKAFNMQYYNIRSGYGYYWFNVLPYISGIIFIAAYELYKYINNRLFNADGSLKSSTTTIMNKSVMNSKPLRI